MADDANFVFRRNRLRAAIARLGEQQHPDDEVLLPLPDPEKALRRLIADILATADRVLVEPAIATAPDDKPAGPAEEVAAEIVGQPPIPPDTIGRVDLQNAGSIIVEAAAEELRSGLADLLLARRRDDYLRAAYRLIRAAWTVAPHDVGAIPAAVYRKLALDVLQEQARIGRAAKQRKARSSPPSERETAFRAAVDQLRERGVAVADLTTAKLLQKAGRCMPPGQTISRQAVDRLLQAYKAANAR